MVMKMMVIMVMMLIHANDIANLRMQNSEKR